MEELLTIKEVCEKMRVSRQTLNTWIKKGKVKVIKVDKVVRIPASQFENTNE